MSTATAQRRPIRRAATPVRRPSPRPPVRAVPTTPIAPARAPFVALVLVVLSLGLGALLLLNTLLAQGSFTLHALEGQVTDLADREQELQQRAAELASPQRLARSAAALGMVPSENPAFLRAEDGKILGEPVRAAAPQVVGSVDPPDSEQSQQSREGSAGQAGDETSTEQQQNTEPQKNTEQSKQNTEQQKNTEQSKQNNQGDGGSDR